MSDLTGPGAELRRREDARKRVERIEESVKRALAEIEEARKDLARIIEMQERKET